MAPVMRGPQALPELQVTAPAPSESEMEATVAALNAQRQAAMDAERARLATMLPTARPGIGASLARAMEVDRLASSDPQVAGLQEEDLRDAMARIEALKAGLQTATLPAQIAAEFTPAGDVMAVIQAQKDFAEGRPVMGAINALSAIPLVGAIGDVARVGSKAVPDALYREVTQALPPRPETNYLRPLRDFTPKLYRETNIDRGLEFLDPRTYSELSGEALFFANTPDLALGQGRNRGVLLEFDSSDLKGQINRNKAAWEPAWDAGHAEFIAKYNEQQQYANAVRAFTVRPDAAQFASSRGYAQRFRGLLKDLEEQGWTKTILEDGSMRFERPTP